MTQANITKVCINFRSDSSVGIPSEEFEMTLPSYVHDGVEITELYEVVKGIYEPYCETSLEIYFIDEEAEEMYNKEGERICSLLEFE